MEGEPLSDELLSKARSRGPGKVGAFAPLFQRLA